MRRARRAGRGADPGAGTFLEPLHLCAEALVEREADPAWADAVQAPDLDLRVGRLELGEHGIMIGRGDAAPPFLLATTAP